MVETFAYANVHKRKVVVDRLIREAGGDPLAVGVCEAVGLGDDQWDRYRRFFGGQGHPSPRWGDTLALTRKQGTVHLGTHGTLVGQPSTPEKVAGLPRFASTSTFDCALGWVAFTVIHCHWAGPAADDPSVDRIQKTDAGMRRLAHQLSALSHMGFRHVVVGDLNVRRPVRTRGWLDPWEMLARLGIGMVDNDLDGVGVGRGLAIRRRVRWIPKDELGTDHPGAVFQVTRTA